jgi:hypothetical protein
MHCHLEILAEPQQVVWAHFRGGDWSRWVLCGGTALALRLGHRRSVDFDFFSSEEVTDQRVGSPE